MTAQRNDINFEEFRTLLNAERTRLTTLKHNTHVGALGEASDSSNESAYSSTDSSENGDTAAILADMERELPLEANVADILKEIDAALVRLDEGTYGLDAVTGDKIPIARLRALPWATMTVETAERIQR